MKDTEFQKLITKTQNAANLHVKLLRELEEEYRRRFGSYPADLDDDWFIDSFSYGNGYINETVKSLTENALNCRKNKS
jgi:hypothetical protein